ncbi:dihydrolipoyl dehydrogenase [Halobacteriovorax sp. BALOs_7]|uniref:dihydrolipoyl dehydrogenase n=1 Tax=unclassified Halobacteriovorax TaxID=2639665 RepID=UPI000EA12434|nr:dihydrolipoyl dehydrogenase [Halobacteriovorax sp. BALOs_7]AYF44911.1 dihydrolipoyl dehydrogenase [Halobacteriovorax sp. BALOs_7]
MSKEFDVVIIGSGPGGYISAVRCAQLGMKVAIVEKYDTLGGTCLNVGCIPSKAWLDSSEKYHEAVHEFEAHGITTGKVKADLKKMAERVAGVVADTSGGITYLMGKNKVETFHGFGSFVDAHTLKVEGEKEETLKAKNFIIATGSKPATIPGIEIDKERIITSTEALKLETLPKHFIVIGGGVIGLELGSVFLRLGSKVSVVEYADSILATMDKDCSKEMRKVLKKQGMEFYTGHGVTEVVRKGAKVHVKAKNKKNEEEIKLEGDYCLMAVGRRPYTDKLGLENAGVNLDERGRVITDDHLRTNVSHIYAIGDVTTGPMLAHKAEEEGVVCAEIIAGQKPHINYNLIPGVVYTWPEVASVGVTEQELKSNKTPYKSGKFPFKASGRARASNESDGFVKVLADKETDEILGVHIVGPRAADLIAEAATAMEFRAAAEDIGRICHAHPTYSEAFKEAALDAFDKKPLNI